MRKFFIKRRRKFIVNSELQYRLVFNSFLQIFLFLAIIGLRLFAPLFIELGKNGPSDEVQRAASVLLYLHANFWPAVLLSIILIGLLSLRTSHRVAGPLYRITRVLTSIKNGSLPKPAPCRKNDLLVAEMEATNLALEKLRSQIQEIQKAQINLHDAIEAYLNKSDHAAADKIIEQLNDIREKERRIADAIAYFNVE